MSRVDIERNAEIAMMRKEGATLKEIAEWYEVSLQRIDAICKKFSDGETKEEIIRNWERKQEEKKKKQMEMSLEFKRLAEKRKDGREYVIMNGEENLYLTKIEPADKHPVIYVYGSANIHDALWFTLEEAKEIAKKRKAMALWVPWVPCC